MPDIAPDGCLGPSVRAEQSDKQLVLHKAPLRMSYAQAARAEPPSKEEKRGGTPSFNYGVAKPPVYLRSTPEEVVAGREEADQKPAVFEQREASIRDSILYSDARNEAWAKKIEYEKALTYAPQGTLFRQPCAISHEQHVVFGDNNGAGYPFSIVADGRLVGCLFCIPGIFTSHFLPLVGEFYARLPRPALPLPIGHELKQKQQAQKKAEEDAQKQAQKQAEQQAEQYADQYAEQQAVDSKSEKEKQRQPSASDLPNSMRLGLPPRVKESLEPYKTSPPETHSALAVLPRGIKQPAFSSRGGPSQRAQSYTLYSNNGVQNHNSDTQDDSSQAYGTSIQDTRAQKNADSLDAKPQAYRQSASRLDPGHPEFVPRAQTHMHSSLPFPQITVTEASSQEQTLSGEFEQSLSLQEAHQQYNAPQSKGTDNRYPLLRSAESTLVLQVPVPRRHIPAGQVQQFDASLQGLTPPQPHLPYSMVPPPPEEQEPAQTELAVSHPSTLLPNAYWYNEALHSGPLLSQGHEFPHQGLYNDQQPYNGQRLFDGQQPFKGQQSVALSRPQLPEQGAAETPSRNGLWIPHEHLDEIGALPNTRAQMMATSEEGLYNPVINGPPGRFPLSNVRSTSQHLAPDGPSHSHYRDGSPSSSGNTIVSESSDGDFAMWDHPGNTTNVTTFERRLAAQGTHRVTFNGKRKYQRSREHASPGNPWAPQEQVNYNHEHQFAARQRRLQQLQLEQLQVEQQIQHHQQEQRAAEEQHFAEQLLLAANNEGFWTQLTTGQLSFIVVRPSQARIEDVTMHSRL